LPDNHILFLTRWYPHKGDEQLGVFIKKHALAVAQFCKVSVLNVKSEKEQQEKFNVTVKATTIFEVQVYYKSTNSVVFNFIRNTKAHFLGYKELEKHYGKPDLIHMHVMFGLSLTTIILSTVKNLPFIISEHWHGFTDGKFSHKNFLFKWLLHFTAKKSAAITVVSSFLKNGMIKNNFRSDILVVPNVVESISDDINMDPEKTTLLSVADLVDDIKNISAVIVVFSEICKTNTTIEYHIIGGGLDEHKLKLQASATGLLNKQIFFHGRQNNEYVLSFLNSCSFVVINSFVETFSVIAAESLLAGKPLVCTNCGGISDFVDDECGRLIEPGNKIQLKEALLFMIENFNTYNSKKLKSKVEERFSSTEIGQQFYSIYQSVLNKN
jgi:glycosyltransferase involved in cell wall biosynthesis